MDKKYFPVKTDTACRLKWAWSTLYLNTGLTASCHRASISSLTADNFDDFHNTPVKLAARQEMLLGQWPTGGCEYCKDIEMSGGDSDRVFQNRVPSIYPPELNHDIEAIHVNPVVLEVFFSNTCNLKCVYCRSDLSSSIQQENAKFGDVLAITEPNDPLYLEFERGNRHEQFIPMFWTWFEKNSRNLQRLQILGGEPLLQKDFTKLLDYFDQCPRSDLEFNIITNLSIPATKVVETADRLASLLDARKLKRVDIQVSVDCWGPAQEYVRSGFNSKLFENNLIKLLSYKKFRIGLLSTICSLTIPTMPVLAEKYLEWKSIHELFWYMHLVLPTGSILDPAIFNGQQLIESLDRVHNILPDRSWDDQQTLSTLAGIRSRIASEQQDDQSKQHKLVKFLEQVDQRRGTDWRKVFPWISTT